MLEITKDILWQLFKALSLKGEEAQENTPSPQKVLIKQNQFTDSKMQVIEVMYCPPEEDDLHNERMTETEIRKMVDNFNKNINNIKGNLGHIVNTEKFHPLKAWVNEVDCMIGDNFVAEGTPLVKIQFNDPDLYEKRKSGEIMGLSIGAMGVINKRDD